LAGNQRKVTNQKSANWHFARPKVKDQKIKSKPVSFHSLACPKPLKKRQTQFFRSENALKKLTQKSTYLAVNLSENSTTKKRDLAFLATTKRKPKTQTQNLSIFVKII